jgi:hypothetical protein
MVKSHYWLRVETQPLILTPTFQAAVPPIQAAQEVTVSLTTGIH